MKPDSLKKKQGTHVRRSASGCLTRTHMNDVHQHMDAVLPGHGTGELHVSSTCIPPRTSSGCHLVHCPQPMDAKYQDSRFVCASMGQTVREMHANHALRQPKRPCRLEWHVAIPQGRVEEQTNTLQSKRNCSF